MIHENIELTGSFTVSGSFVLPSHPSSSAVYETGSLYHDSVGGVLKVYTGTQWVTVGEQTASAAGGAVLNTDLEYLLVAGGGAGGNTYSYGVDGGGGGGAGGLLSSSLASVESGSSFTVTIGAGGSQATNAQGGAGVDSSIAGATISTITTTGGGGGGGYSTNAGGNGGSGGGSTNAGAAGSGTVGQGNDGYGGGGNANGGGGATQVGGVDQSPNGGQGGSGSLSYITGTATGYAGGGSGGSDSSTSTYTAGGYGGGGRGAAPGAALIGENGITNTGGGGGGGSANDSYSNGGSGGSGVAIFAYDSGSLSGLGGIKTARSDGYVVHTFNSSGTLTIGGPNDYSFPIASSNFDVLTFTSPGSLGTSTAVTGLNFTPSLVLIQTRNLAFFPRLTDVVRGVDNALYPSEAYEQNNESSGYYNVLSFNSDGFNYRDYQESTANQVAWCWKGGGAGVSNTDGDITSTVSANSQAGFSIVKYTGNGGTNQTVGTGLSAGPEYVIFKKYDAATNWYVFNRLSDGSYRRYEGLNNTNAGVTPVYFEAVGNKIKWNGTTGDFNGNGNNYIMYCWHSVGGYSKIGSYTGTGAINNVITTGFQPKFVLIKGTHSAAWRILDSARGTDKSIQIQDTTVTEYDDSANYLDFETTGFAFRSGNTGISNSDFNGNGNTYTYLAFSQ